MLMAHAFVHACRHAEEVQLAQRLRLDCQERLARAGPEREISGLLLGHLLMRPDCQASMRRFVAWAAVQLRCTEPVAVFLVPGV